MMKSCLTPAVLLVAGALATGCGSADPGSEQATSRSDLAADPWQALADVQACLDGRTPGPIDPATGWTVCSLPAGTFTLDGRIIPGGFHPYLDVGRSGHILRGAGPGATIITRGTTSLQSLLFVDDGVFNAAIEQLTVNGNRFAFSTNYAGKSFEPGCFPSNDAYIDVNVQPGAGGNLHLRNVSLLNAPSTALQHASSLVAENIFVSTARSTGVQMYGSGGSIVNSGILFSGTAAITVHGSSETIRNVWLTGNRREQPDGVPGGQLNLEPESVAATVDGVSIYGLDYMVNGGRIALNDGLTGMPFSCPAFSNDGKFPLGVEGIEGYGLFHRLSNITSRANSSTGMILKGAQFWTLSNITIDGNGLTGTGGGLEFLPYPGRNNVGVALNAVTITNTHFSFGLHLEAMQGIWGLPTGCDARTYIRGNPLDLEIGPGVDPGYQNSCAAVAGSIGTRF